MQRRIPVGVVLALLVLVVLVTVVLLGVIVWLLRRRTAAARRREHVRVCGSQDIGLCEVKSSVESVVMSSSSRLIYTGVSTSIHNLLVMGDKKLTFII